LIAAAIALVTLFPVGRWSLQLVGWIRGAGPAGAGVFAFVYVVATALLLPGSILTLGAGFAYGPILGTLLVSPVSVVAATLSFLLARFVARNWVSRKVARDPRFAAIDRAVGESGFKIVALVRLSPVLPFNLLNYALGLTRVTLRDYVLASTVGMFPGTVLYVYLGSLVTSASELAGGNRPDPGPWGRLLYWGGLVATLLVTVVVTRVARRALRVALNGGPSGASQPPSNDLNSSHAPLTAPGCQAPGVVEVAPDDAHNRALVAHVHPSDWVNPRPGGRYNLVVIGGGTAGLVSAMGAAGLGARVALVERHLLGGDCLNYGCVPSKALIRAARAAFDARHAGTFGVRAGETGAVDFAVAMDRMRRLRAGIAHHDSAKRFADAGIDVFLGGAKFVSPDEIEVAGARLRFSRAVIATGARAAVPPIPGLLDAGFLTNESVFSLTSLPRRLAVVGAGPIGCELAQAFRRFGSDVTLVGKHEQLLPREDPDAAAILHEQLVDEGVVLILGANVKRVTTGADGKRLSFERGRGLEDLVVDEILVAVGRAPNVEGLGLETAGVAFGRSGVEVDDHLRTANPRIFAAGDICSPYKFTHAADAMARTVLQNALFMGRKRASKLVIPWSTYTDPEIAHVGLPAREATAQGISVKTFTVPLADVDRAVLDGETIGFARLHVDEGDGRILGATVVARHAGEMIGEAALAITEGLSARSLSTAIHPYPTQSEVWKRLGDQYSRTLLKPWIRRLLERYLAWRR
jgi:pyruvate/2-oxoglutarate dehydrogenase complex dihydrolipoamide dehydrogenase (E3) component/uncharacterized membrane protein YdjX (TVP38/TMEM64 family)